MRADLHDHADQNLNSNVGLVGSASQPFRDTRHHERKLARFGRAARFRRLAERLFWLYPTLNLGARRAYAKVREHEGAAATGRRYLVIGSGVDEGAGIRALGEIIRSRIVNVDIERFENVHIRADGRALPFQDQSFAGVFCQAMLYAVVDPLFVLREMDRVLRPKGVLYVEAPFLQPHMDAPTDSTRITLSALREVFRSYRELDAGATAGPSSTLAWILREYITLWISPSLRWNNVVRFFINPLVFPLKYLDLIVGRRAGAHLLGCAVSFLGEKPSDGVAAPGAEPTRTAATEADGS